LKNLTKTGDFAALDKNSLYLYYYPLTCGKSRCVRFEILTAVVMKSTQLAPCFHAGNMLSLFDPEDGGDMFLKNVG
jgi:hypothetical protein